MDEPMRLQISLRKGVYEFEWNDRYEELLWKIQYIEEAIRRKNDYSSSFLHSQSKRKEKLSNELYDLIFKDE